MFDWIDGDDYDKSVRERFAEDPNSVNWEIISCSYRLSEKYMREFQDYLDWNYIQRYGWEYLNDNFIREFRDKFPNVVLYEEQSQENRKDLKDIYYKTRLKHLW